MRAVGAKDLAVLHADRGAQLAVGRVQVDRNTAHVSHRFRSTAGLRVNWRHQQHCQRCLHAIASISLFTKNTMPMRSRMPDATYTMEASAMASPKLSRCAMSPITSGALPPPASHPIQ